jgi:parvulin-like peptidyl-prolyl isomerase
VALKFGDRFAAALDSVPVGRWSGPMESRYGLHLVLIRERKPGSIPILAEVRDQVRRQILNERRQSGMDALYEQMRDNYQVSVRWPGDTAGASR